MKKKILLASMVLLSQLLPAQTPEIYSRVQIDLKGRSIEQLATTGIEVDHGEYLPGRSLTVELSQSEINAVQQAGFSTTVLIPDFKKWYLENRDKPAAELRGADCNDSGNSGAHSWKTPENYIPGSMGGYFTYAEMLAMIDDMRVKFPNLITARAIVSDTIVTHENRPLWWVRISDNADTDEPEAEALYTALHHAREPNSLSQLLFYMWYLLENYGTDPTIQYLVDNTELYFIPCLNPDGYLFNEATDPQGGGFWRKNRRDNGDGSFGVDLNRNYGYEWGIDDEGSSSNPSSEVYRGPGPFSEPETRMVRDFCLQHSFQFALNYHTRGNLLIYPWAYSDALADPTLADFAKLFTRENNYTYGTTTQTVGYRVNGSSDDWMLGAADIFSYTPEVGPPVWGFWPPEDAIDGLNKANMWQNLMPGFCMLRFGTVSDQSGTTFDLSKPEIPFRVTRYGYENGPLTVSLQAVSSNILSVGSPKTFTLNQFEHADDAISVALTNDVQPGDVAVFILQLDNGIVQFRDTLVKQLLGPALPLFTDNGTAPLEPEWSTSLGTWAVTDATYVSAPTSITDSPAGNYLPDEYSVLELITPISIPADAKTAQLRFFGRWELEAEFDYVQVYATSASQGSQALCGRYTKPGSIFQIEGAPLFDGFQTEWVEECMDLNAFIGEDITLQFILISDGFQEHDGFYFDDLRIEYTQEDFVGVNPVGATQFVLRQNQPNPAGDFTTISWTAPVGQTGTGMVQVYDVLGKMVFNQPVNLSQQQKIRLDTKGWPAGQYWYRLQAEGWQTAPRKMLVAKR